MSTRKSHSPMRRLGMLAAAFAFGIAGVASAQPAGHHHGPGGPGAMIEGALFAAKAQLNLNTSQQQAWDRAVADTKAARDTGRTNFQSLRTALQTELAKPEPDLAALAAAADAVEQKNHQLRTSVRNEWLAIYNTFSPEQKAVVKQTITQRLGRMQDMRQRFQQRQGGG